VHLTVRMRFLFQFVDKQSELCKCPSHRWFISNRFVFELKCVRIN